MHPAAEALCAYMSELSEEAYYAGWMQGLEFALWDAVVYGPRQYGHLHIEAAHIARLRELASRCGGWIYFDERVNQESFVPAAEWETLYRKAPS